MPHVIRLIIPSSLISFGRVLLTPVLLLPGSNRIRNSVKEASLFALAEHNSLSPHAQLMFRKGPSSVLHLYTSHLTNRTHSQLVRSTAAAVRWRLTTLDFMLLFLKMKSPFLWIYLSSDKADTIIFSTAQRAHYLPTISTVDVAGAIVLTSSQAKLLCVTLDSILSCDTRSVSRIHLPQWLLADAAVPAYPTRWNSSIGCRSSGE